jgi:hypothetical protein
MVGAATFFVASLFFIAASFGQLVQSQSPGMAATGSGLDDERRPVRLFAVRPGVARRRRVLPRGCVAGDPGVAAVDVGR